VASPVKADRIVALGGDGGARVVKSAALHREGYAPRLLRTGVEGGDDRTRRHYLDWRAKYLIDQRVPRSALLFDNASKSSWEEAVSTLALVRREGWKRGLIVSDPPQLWRLSWVWHRLAPPAGIEYRVVAPRALNWCWGITEAGGAIVAVGARSRPRPLLRGLALAVVGATSGRDGELSSCSCWWWRTTGPGRTTCAGPGSCWAASATPGRVGTDPRGMGAGSTRAERCGAIAHSCGARAPGRSPRAVSRLRCVKQSDPPRQQDGILIVAVSACSWPRLLLRGLGLGVVGNSLGVRLPREVLSRMHLSDGDRLVLTEARKSPMTPFSALPQRECLAWTGGGVSFRISGGYREGQAQRTPPSSSVSPARGE
jgi:hypothetical protein